MRLLSDREQIKTGFIARLSEALSEFGRELIERNEDTYAIINSEYINDLPKISPRYVRKTVEGLYDPEEIGEVYDNLFW